MSKDNIIINVIIFCFLLVSLYMFIKILFDKKGIYKVQAIPMLIFLYDAVIIFNANNQARNLSIIECVIMLIGLIVGYVYSAIFVMKSSNIGVKMGTIFTWFYVLFVIAVSMLQIQFLGMLYVFKGWLMLTLLLGLLTLKELPLLIQFIGAIILYILMLGANVMLTTQFLTVLPDNYFWRRIYEIVQRIYCLNPVNGQMSDLEALMYIIDFFLCRIMDMILLSFFSTKFINLMNISKTDTKVIIHK